MIRELQDKSVGLLCLVSIFAALVSVVLIIEGLGEKLTDVLIKIF